MKIIDGKGVVLGRLSSYVAKEVLKGEEIVIVNCGEIIITGNKKSIEKNFEKKRGRIGSSQKGPKHHKTSEKIVKRAIRGMLPDHRKGKGRECYKKIKCYEEVPKEFQGEKMIQFKKINKTKFSFVSDFVKK